MRSENHNAHTIRQNPIFSCVINEAIGMVVHWTNRSCLLFVVVVVFHSHAFLPGSACQVCSGSCYENVSAL